MLNCCAFAVPAPRHRFGDYFDAPGCLHCFSCAMNEQLFAPCPLHSGMLEPPPSCLVGCSDAPAAFALMIAACWDVFHGASNLELQRPVCSELSERL